MARNVGFPWLCTIALAIVVTPRDLRAQGDAIVAEPVRVRFDASPGCPTADHFLAEIRARTSRVRAAVGDEPARTFRVTVTQEGDRSLGKLVVEDDSHASSPRAIGGKTCHEVVSALALIAALAVDPMATTGAVEASAGVPDEAPPDPATAAAGVAARPGPEPATAAPELMAPLTTSRGSLSSPAAAVRPSAARGPSVVELGAGGAFELVGAAAPGVAPGASAFLEVARAREGLFAPSARVGFARHAGGDVVAGQGGGHFAWSVARLEACPLRVAVARGLAVTPCIFAEAGTVSATSSGPPNAHGSVRPWVAPGLLARLAWRFWGPFKVETHAGFATPITREDFVFAPSVAVYTAPRVMLVAGLGAGVTFP